MSFLSRSARSSLVGASRARFTPSTSTATLSAARSYSSEAPSGGVSFKLSEDQEAYAGEYIQIKWLWSGTKEIHVGRGKG